MFKTRSIAMMAFAMIANIAFGQNLKVTSNGTPVSNNDVIEIPYVYEDYSYPELDMYLYEYMWEPNLAVSVSSGSETLTITVSSADNNDGFMLCWPGSCVDRKPGDSVSSTGTVNTEPQHVDLHKDESFTSKDQVPTETTVIKVNFATSTENMEITVKCLPSAENSVGENFADSNVAPEYYTIQGIRVNEPQKGQLLIERKGNKVTKRIF